MEIRDWATNRVLEGLSAKLMISKGKISKKVFQRIDKNQLRDLHEGAPRINHSRSSEKRRCFFNILTPAPHWCCLCSSSRVSGLWLFDTTFPTVRFWHWLTRGCLCLSRIIWKKFISHVTKELFREQFEKLYTDRFEKRVHRWRRCVEQAGNCMEKRGIDTTYTLWAIFCMLLHFNILSGCKDINMGIILSERHTYFIQGLSKRFER